MQTRHRTGIEYKDIDATQMRATNDRLGIIEGLMNRIGNIDYQKDRAHKGNWVNTIKAAYARKTAGDPYLVPFLWSHNFDALPPGGVFYLDETKEGLFGKVQFNLDIQSGAELYASYRAGTVSKQSVGYKCLKCDYTKGDDGQAIRELKECELLECSSVVFPANALARANALAGWNVYSGASAPSIFEEKESEEEERELIGTMAASLKAQNS